MINFVGLLCFFFLVFTWYGITESISYPARRSAGGRKLWEAKDEKPWVHDRFEELKLNDESYPGQVLVLVFSVLWVCIDMIEIAFLVLELFSSRLVNF